MVRVIFSKTQRKLFLPQNSTAKVQLKCECKGNKYIFFFRHMKIPKFTFLKKLFQDVSSKMQDSWIVRNIGWICITEADFSNLKEEKRLVVTSADTNLNDLPETTGQGLERLSSGITAKGQL